MAHSDTLSRGSSYFSFDASSERQFVENCGDLRWKRKKEESTFRTKHFLTEKNSINSELWYLSVGSEFYNWLYYNYNSHFNLRVFFLFAEKTSEGTHVTHQGATTGCSGRSWEYQSKFVTVDYSHARSRRNTLRGWTLRAPFQI